MTTPIFHAGDLLFFYGRGFDSRAIEICTAGPSHVGMIFIYRDTPMLVESTTLSNLPCAIRETYVKGVQAQMPLRRVAAYRGRVFHSPMRWGCRFHRAQSRQLTELIVEEFFTNEQPTPYDLAGALESPTLLPFLTPPDLGSLFCSALCALLLMDFSKLNRENPKGITPAGLKRRTVKRQATHEPLCELKV